MNSLQVMLSSQFMSLELVYVWILPCQVEWNLGGGAKTVSLKSGGPWPPWPPWFCHLCKPHDNGTQRVESSVTKILIRRAGGSCIFWHNEDMCNRCLRAYCQLQVSVFLKELLCKPVFISVCHECHLVAILRSSCLRNCTFLAFQVVYWLHMFLFPDYSKDTNNHTMSDYHTLHHNNEIFKWTWWMLCYCMSHVHYVLR